MRYLIDSNIIIYHLNNESIATKFLIENQSECAISQITYIEVLSFDFSQQQQDDVMAFLEIFTILDINKKISLQATKNRRLKKIKIPDNIIVSTAQVYDLVLVTRNVNDFNSLNVQILNPFEMYSAI